MNNSFVAIDFETANSFRGSVCEVGLVRVIDGIVDDSFAVLVKPHADHSHFNGINVSIHGIHPTDVLAAEEFDTLWPALKNFIGDFPLVAHNAAFDIGALRELFALYAIEVPTIYYFCTLALSRRALDLVSFSLPFVAKNFGIEPTVHHRAGADALCAAQIVLALLALEHQADLFALADKLQVAVGHFDDETWFRSRASSGTYQHVSKASIETMRSSAGETHADPDGQLFGKRVAFTGGLSSMTRAEAAAQVLSCGGEPEVGVTKRTDFLVIGVENGYTLDPHTAFTAKFQKAELLRGKGSLIEILDELTFTRML